MLREEIHLRKRDRPRGTTMSAKKREKERETGHRVGVHAAGFRSRRPRSQQCGRSRGKAGAARTTHARRGGESEPCDEYGRGKMTFVGTKLAMSAHSFLPVGTFSPQLAMTFVHSPPLWTNTLCVCLRVPCFATQGITYYILRR